MAAVTQRSETKLCQGTVIHLAPHSDSRNLLQADENTLYYVPKLPINHRKTVILSVNTGYAITCGGLASGGQVIPTRANLDSDLSLTYFGQDNGAEGLLVYRVFADHTEATLQLREMEALRTALQLKCHVHSRKELFYNLAACLLLLTKRQARNEIYISHEQLALILNANRTTVSKAIAKLRSQGGVSKHGHSYIHLNPSLLKNLILSN